MGQHFQINRIFKNNELKESEQEILQQILGNPERVQQGGIRKLAKENFTSPATIDRLAKKVGYSGYSELLYNAKQLAKSEVEHSSAESPIITNIADDEFDPLLARILSPKRVIYLYGEGFNEFVTNYIYRKLLIHKYQVLLLYGIEIPLVYQTGQETSLLVISRSGENFSCLQKIKQAKEISSSVLSITANLSSTISEESDLAIQITDTKSVDMANLQYTTFFGDSINMFERLLDKVNERDCSESQ